MRFLAWMGGILFGLGLAILVAGILSWAYGGNRNDWALFVAAIVAWITIRLIRAMVRMPAARSALSWATWTTLILLLITAYSSSQDTKAAGHRVQMVAHLHTIRDGEAHARRDSGRYTPTPELADSIPGVTADISITRDGWAAAVEHAQLPGVKCAMYEGSEALAPATQPGEAQCAGRSLATSKLLSGLSFMVVGTVLVAAAQLKPAARV